MVQRSCIAPASDVRLFRKRGGKAPLRPSRIAFMNVVALVLLAAVACALPALFRLGFFLDQGRDVAAFAMATGEWARDALAAAFQSIPVR